MSKRTRNAQPVDPRGPMPGTLDLLILHAVSREAKHGYAILLHLEAIAGGALAIEQGALYPALARLERKGRLEATWGVSTNNRRAKFYALTAAGRRQYAREEQAWLRVVSIMALCLDT